MELGGGIVVVAVVVAPVSAALDHRGRDPKHDCCEREHARSP